MPRQPAPNDPPSIPDVTGLEPLDRGGQGEVFVGTWRDGRKVAVRIAPVTEVDAETARLRADQEGGLLRRLAHPNLVPLVAHGTIGTSTYVVMELVEGIDLSREIARRADRPLRDVESTLPRNNTSAPTQVLTARAQADLLAEEPAMAPPALTHADHWRWVATIGVQLCGALDRLHSAGFLHRDLKPRNVMVKPDGAVVLVDLGLVTAGDLVRVATDHAVAGTWAYMSPEQREGQGISTRSDIYGLGCTLYECLVGQPPLTVATKDGSSSAVAPPSVRLANAAVPEALADVLRMCLDPLPGNRYVAARDLGDDLLAVLAGKPVGWRRRQWSRRAVTAAAMVLALGLTGGTWWAARRDMPILPRVLAALRGGDLAGATATVNAAVDRSGLLTEVAQKLSPEEVEPQRWLATTMEFGLIEVEACPGVHVGFCAADLEYQGAIQRWHRPTTRLAFVVEPGRYKIVVVDAADGEPTPASATLPARLATSSQHLVRCTQIQDAWRRLPPVPMCTVPNEECALRLRLDFSEADEVSFRASDGLQIARDEMDAVASRIYAEWVQRNPPERLDLFAHPDEPKGTCTEAAFETWRRGPFPPRETPLQTSFWLAHRVAGFYGGRLPTAREWALAAALSYARDAAHAASSGLPLAPPLARTELAPSGSVDPHVGALGINYLIDSVREWTCTRVEFLDESSMFCPVGPPLRPSTTTVGRVTGSAAILSFEDGMPSNKELGGVRLVRETYRR